MNDQISPVHAFDLWTLSDLWQWEMQRGLCGHMDAIRNVSFAKVYRSEGETMQELCSYRCPGAHMDCFRFGKNICKMDRCINVNTLNTHMWMRQANFTTCGLSLDSLWEALFRIFSYMSSVDDWPAQVMARPPPRILSDHQLCTHCSMKCHFELLSHAMSNT